MTSEKLLDFFQTLCDDNWDYFDAEEDFLCRKVIEDLIRTASDDQIVQSVLSHENENGEEEE